MLRGSWCQRKLPDAYNLALPSRIVLWQHVGSLWLLGGYSIEKWPARRGNWIRDSELVAPHAIH